MKEHDILRFLYSNEFNIDLTVEVLKNYLLFFKSIKNYSLWVQNKKNFELTLDALKILVNCLLI